MKGYNAIHYTWPYTTAPFDESWCFKTLARKRGLTDAVRYLDAASSCAHFIAYSVIRCAKGRYRFRIHVYGVDYLTRDSHSFVNYNAIVLQSMFGGSPMNGFAASRSANVDVYAMTILAHNAKGEPKRSSPILARHRNPNASGISHTLPISALYLDDLYSMVQAPTDQL